MSPHDGGDPSDGGSSIGRVRSKSSEPPSTPHNSRRLPSLSPAPSPGGVVRMDSGPSSPGGTSRYASRRLSFHKQSRRADSLDDMPTTPVRAAAVVEEEDEEEPSGGDQGSSEGGSTSGTEESDNESTEDEDGPTMPHPLPGPEETRLQRSERLAELPKEEQDVEEIPSIDQLRLRHRKTAPVRYLIDKDAPPISRLSHRIRAPFQVAVSSTPEIIKLQEGERKLMVKERAWLVKTMGRGGEGGQEAEEQQWQVAIQDHKEGRSSKHGSRRRKRDVVFRFGPVAWVRSRYEDLVETRPEGFLAPHAESWFHAVVDTGSAVDLKVKGQTLPDRLLRVRQAKPGKAWDVATGTMKKLTVARKQGANLNTVMAKYRRATGHERQDTADPALGLWLNESRPDSLDLGPILSRASGESSATTPYLLSALAIDSQNSLDDLSLFSPSLSPGDLNGNGNGRPAGRPSKGKTKAADNVDVPAVILEGCEIGHESPEDDEELLARPPSQLGTPVNRSRLSLINTAPPTRAPSPSYFDEDMVKSPEDVPDLRLEADENEDDDEDREARGIRHFVFPPPRARTPSPATGAPQYLAGLAAASSARDSPARSPVLSPTGPGSPPTSPPRKAGKTLAPPSRDAPSRPGQPPRPVGEGSMPFPRQIPSNASTATYGQYTRSPHFTLSALHQDFGGSGASTPDRGDTGSPSSVYSPSSKFARFAEQAIITLDHSPEREHDKRGFNIVKRSSGKRGGKAGAQHHHGHHHRGIANGGPEPKTSAGMQHHVGKQFKRGATTVADRLPAALTRHLRLSQHASQVIREVEAEAAAAAELADMLAQVAIEDEGKKDVLETDIMFQNQGGTVLFGRAHFTGRLAEHSWEAVKVIKKRTGHTWDSMYEPGDGKPKRVKTKYNITSYPVPTDDWEWITDWAVDMRGDVDADGWQYFDLMTGRWRADRMSLRNFVRRRAFIRTRSKKPLDLGGAERTAGGKKEVGRWVGEEVLEEDRLKQEEDEKAWVDETAIHAPRVSMTLDGLTQATRTLPFPRHILLGLEGDIDFRNPFFPMRKINEEWEATRKHREAVHAHEGKEAAHKDEEETIKQEALAEVNLHRVQRALRDIMTDREKLRLWRHWLHLPPSASSRSTDDTTDWPRPDHDDVWQVVAHHLEEVTRLFLFARSRRDFIVLLCHHLHKHDKHHHYHQLHHSHRRDGSLPLGSPGDGSAHHVHLDPEKTTPQIHAGISLLQQRPLLPFWSQIIPLLVRYSGPADASARSSMVTKEAIELRKILDSLEARKSRYKSGAPHHSSHHHHRQNSTQSTSGHQTTGQSGLETDLSTMSDLFPRGQLQRNASTATTIDTVNTTTQPAVSRRKRAATASYRRFQHHPSSSR